MSIADPRSRLTPPDRPAAQMRVVETCPVCGSADLELFSSSLRTDHDPHWAQDRCRRCGLLIAQPQAEQADIDAFYRAGYHESQSSDGDSSWAHESLSMLRRDVWPVLAALGQGWLPAGARVLDVGCGYGAMAAVLIEQGFRVIGTDLSQKAASFCRARGVAVFISRSAAVRPGSFDVAIARHVIEHVTDPRRFTTTLVSAVRPGGVVVIEIENNWISQYAWDRARAKLRRRPAPFRTAREHTYVFGARHLRVLLFEAGCSEVRSATFAETPGAENLHWRAYKGTFRSIDRLLGLGPLVMAVGRVGGRP